MKRILLTLACLLAFAVSAFATEDRMLTLPQDQGTWYLTIFGEANAESQRLQNWLKTDVGLIRLKSQVRFNEYSTDELRYQRYVEDVPGLPCIRLQNEMGLVVSEFWDDNIPLTSDALYQGIRGDLKDKTSWGRRRKRCPSPRPEPPKLPDVIVNVEPPPLPTGPPVLDDPEPEPEPEESRLWILLAVLAVLGGGALGFYREYTAEHMDRPITPSTKL